jgi:hypothetical protein
MHTILLSGSLKGRDHWEDLDVGGRKLLECISYIRKTGWEVVDWIHVAQDSDQWRAFANTVTNLRVP